jgi:hypothetical protein
VQGGFTALEGPVGAADGTVYFSDRMPDRTYHLGLDGSSATGSSKVIQTVSHKKSASWRCSKLVPRNAQRTKGP